MVQILLMLNVLFTQDFKADDLFFSAPSAIICMTSGLSMFKMTFSRTLLE